MGRKDTPTCLDIRSYPYKVGVHQHEVEVTFDDIHNEITSTSCLNYLLQSGCATRDHAWTIPSELSPLLARRVSLSTSTNSFMFIKSLTSGSYKIKMPSSRMTSACGTRTDSGNLFFFSREEGHGVVRII